MHRTMDLKDELAPVNPGGMLATLTFCHFINDYYAMLITPLLPYLAREFQLSYFESGMLIFMANIVSSVLQPIIGYFSDLRMRRRFVIVLGLCIYALTSAALGLVQTKFFLLSVLFLMGIGGSTYHPQSTFFIKRYFTKMRATASGIHGISNPLGFVAAPIVVVALINTTGSWRISSILMCIPGILAALLAWRMLEEPNVIGSKGFLSGFKSLPLVLLTIVSGITLAVFMGFTTFLPFYSTNAGSILPASWWLPATLVPGIISQPLGGLVADKLGHRNLIILGLAALSGALFGFINSTGNSALGFSLAVGFCLGLLVPVCLIYAAELAVGERVGTAVGIMWGFSMAMGSLAPLWVGHLRDVFPDFRMAFMSLVLVAVLGIVLSFFLPGRKKQTSESPT